MARPLGSTRITGLLSYYRTVRHCLLDIGTLPLADWPLVGSPSHDRTDQLRPWPARIAAPRRSFTRSTLAPEPGSRRLYAGCRLGSAPGLPQAYPEASCILGCDIFRCLSTRHRRFTLVRLHRFTPDALYGRLFGNAHHPGRCAGAACRGLEPPPDRRPRGAYLHHQRSTLSGPPSTSEPPPRFASQIVPAKCPSTRSGLGALPAVGLAAEGSEHYPGGLQR